MSSDEQQLPPTSNSKPPRWRHFPVTGQPNGEAVLRAPSLSEDSQTFESAGMLTTAVGSRDREIDEKSTLSQGSGEKDRSNMARCETSREVEARLHDDLELLRAERIVSYRQHELERNQTRRQQRQDPDDDTFNPKAEREESNSPQQAPNKMLLRVRKFPRLVRYFLYLLPVSVILLVPVLLGIFKFQRGSVGGVGGVELRWFGIWLEIVWLSLWAARITTAIMPYICKAVAGLLGSSNSKNWKDVGHQLELPTALFLWMLAVLISFLPIINNHRVASPGVKDGSVADIAWIDVTQKVIIALFVLATLNFVEKVLIQWIATAFHERTYSKRISDYNDMLRWLVKLYENSKSKLTQEDSIWHKSAPAATAQSTPLRVLQNKGRNVVSGVGNVVHRIAGDFTGRKYHANSSRKVVQEMLKSTDSAKTLARLIFRALKLPDADFVTLEDVEAVIEDKEEAEMCFSLLDKDLNGDLGMAELELVCDEVHREKKSISASVKDLDAVIGKLDRVFFTLCVVISCVVFVAIISSSSAAALTSAGTAVLGLSWLLQSTAQEFLQSVIFVFVKHPYDVGDRVTIYGNTGPLMKGDDYYVTEIHLLFSVFKKLQGQIVQAPNSVLNGLFILNHQRSSSLADPVPLVLRWGTAPELLEKLKERMQKFVLEHKRDYQSLIITEVKELTEVYSFTMNFVFFHKSSFQNELVRLNRHNKFLAQLMYEMHDLGIEGPRRADPGGNPGYPVYWTQVSPPAYHSSEAPRSADAAASSTTTHSHTVHPIPEEGSDIAENSSGGSAGGAAAVLPPVSYGAQLSRIRSGHYMHRTPPSTDPQDVFESRRLGGGASRRRGASVTAQSELDQLATTQEEHDRALERALSHTSDRRGFSRIRKSNTQMEV